MKATFIFDGTSVPDRTSFKVVIHHLDSHEIKPKNATNKDTQEIESNVVNGGKTKDDISQGSVLEDTLASAPRRSVRKCKLRNVFESLQYRPNKISKTSEGRREHS